MIRVRRIIVIVLGIILLAFVILYGGSEWIIRRNRHVPLKAVAVPHDPASVAEGRRIATFVGCRSCHQDGKGLVLLDDFGLGRVVAPPLARAAAKATDAELARTIRHGVRRNGSTLFVMMTQAHRYLADDDVAKVIAWVRSLKPGSDDTRASLSWGPKARWMMLTGAIEPSVRPDRVAPRHRPADSGRYIVQVSCKACHALDHEQQVAFTGSIAPALAPVAAAYDPAAFKRLLRTGIGAGNRPLGEMREAALTGLHALSDPEIDAVHTYLAQQAADQLQH